METNQTEPHEEMWQKWETEHKRGKVIGGVVIVIAGALFLASELGVAFPEWLFTWKVLLIVVGLVIGIKHRFRDAKWLIPVIIGSLFLVSDLFPDITIRPILWPIMIILFGLFIIFKPHRKHRHHRWERWHRHHQKNRDNYEKRWASKAEVNSDDVIDSTCFMAEVKKSIISKNFKRGDVTVVLAGTELNFSQADFEEKAYLELTAVLGGIQLILPAHWEIKSELVCVMGGIEDKRAIQPTALNDSKKVLILRGTVFMGGVEIKSY